MSGVVALLLVVGAVVLGVVLAGDDGDDDGDRDTASQSDSGSPEDPGTPGGEETRPIEPSASADVPEPDPAEPSESPEGADPVVGTCYALSAADLEPTSTGVEVVDCASSRATAQTIRVSTLDSFDDATFTEAGAGCYRDVAKALGISPPQIYQSLASWVYFRPTDEQWAAGARWFRCDLVFSEGDEKPLPLPDDLDAVYSQGTVESAYRACLDTLNNRVRCSRPGATYEWTKALNRTDAARRPNDANMTAWAEPRCSPLANGGLWYATWPSAESWKQGWTAVTCWKVKTG